MSSKRLRVSGGLILLATVCSLGLLTGCSEKPGGQYKPNVAPNTFISFGPKEESRTYFKVQFYWYGTDEDGSVTRFQVATVPDITIDSLRNIDFDDLPYITTAATESTFVLPADSCCAISGTAQMALSYWGLLVRAVDNDGAVDPEPASLFFQASNVVPRVRLAVPYKAPIQSMTASPSTYVEWRGTDADGDVGRMSYKYIISAVKKTEYPGPPARPPSLPSLDHVYTLPKTPGAVTPEGYWSDWVPADCTYVKDVNLSSFIPRTDYFARFTVTCRDEGGAALPQALYGDYNSDTNWVMLTVLSQGSGIKIRVDAGPLGFREAYNNANASEVAGLFEGTQVAFRFWGRETRDEGKLVQEYKYYYDDPEDPRTSTWNYWTSTEPIRDRAANPEWLVRYPAVGERLVPTLGPHVFAVELRDLNKDVTHCEFRLEVLRGPVGKPRLVYFVDDDIGKWMGERYQWYESGSDSLWAAILDPYNFETFNTSTSLASPFTRPVPIRRIADATTVIWNVDQDSERPDCQLTNVCYNKGNYLSSYVKVGGNLILIGRDPIYACQFWPDQTPVVTARGDKTVLDFLPKEDAAGDTMYNFVYDVLGIEKMAVSNPDLPTKELWPCEAGWPSVTTTTIPGVYGWPGRLDNVFFITQVRTNMGVPVSKIYTVVPLDAQGQPGTPDCGTLTNGKWIGVYVPAHGDRGHAVYLSVPPWFFDHDEVKALIQKLLDMFGEPRLTG
jgi:hypothetical protein